ncbi:hypothetical protein [Kribbella sp. NPDC051718]|uniref:hypothetical protein n=1 Tax=Kribbella sp. NPDC051718 TaxID=3155168 RepID=UPI00343B0F9A
MDEEAEAIAERSVRGAHLRQQWLRHELPTQNCPSVGGLASSPNLRTPALPTQSPSWSCTRS